MALHDELFALSEAIRYVAVYPGYGEPELRERPDLADTSSSDSDRYEELLVNPALLLLARQRGEIDCGGLEYVLVRYGSFFQLVLPRAGGGHVSIAVDRDADPLALVAPVRDLLAGS
jgi:hypothetical protein